jgi:hypothetical protein
MNDIKQNINKANKLILIANINLCNIDNLSITFMKYIGNIIKNKLNIKQVIYLDILYFFKLNENIDKILENYLKYEYNINIVIKFINIDDYLNFMYLNDILNLESEKHNLDKTSMIYNFCISNDCKFDKTILFTNNIDKYYQLILSIIKLLNNYEIILFSDMNIYKWLFDICINKINIKNKFLSLNNKINLILIEDINYSYNYNINECYKLNSLNNITQMINYFTSNYNYIYDNIYLNCSYKNYQKYSLNENIFKYNSLQTFFNLKKFNIIEYFSDYFNIGEYVSFFSNINMFYNTIANNNDNNINSSNYDINLKYLLDIDYESEFNINLEEKYIFNILIYIIYTFNYIDIYYKTIIEYYLLNSKFQSIQNNIINLAINFNLILHIPNSYSRYNFIKIKKQIINSKIINNYIDKLTAFINDNCIKYNFNFKINVLFLDEELQINNFNNFNNNYNFVINNIIYKDLINNNNIYNNNINNYYNLWIDNIINYIKTNIKHNNKLIIDYKNIKKTQIQKINILDNYYYKIFNILIKD